MSPSKRPPLDEVLALFHATVAAEGVTTGPGAGTGDSIVDAGLAGSGANSFFSMLMVVYPGQPRLVDSMDITGFNDGTGEVTLSTAYKGVIAPIPAGVPYKIVTFRFVPAEVAAIEAKLDHAAHGLAALKALIDLVEGKLDVLDPLIDDILEDTGTTLPATLTAIAGYIDTEVAAILADTNELQLSLADGGFTNLLIDAIKAETALIVADTNELQTDWVNGGRLDLLIDAIKAQTDKIAGKLLFSMDFWSAPQEEVLLSDIAAPGTDVQLPSVTVAGLPNGATIVRAVAMFKFRMVENTAAGVNKLQGGQHIQVEDDGPGTLRDAISLLDDMFTLAATPCREGGDVLIGDHDISVEVDGLDTYLFFWTASLVDAANLQFNDVQTGLRIWYSV